MMTKQQERQRINDIRNIARSGLVNLSKGNLAHKLTVQSVAPQESAAPADPSYVNPSSSVAGADPAYSSTGPIKAEALGRASSSSGPAEEKLTYSDFDKFLSEQSIQGLQNLHQQVFGKPTDSFDKYYIKQKLLKQYKSQQDAFTTSYLEQQAKSAMTISKLKPKNK
jgi:hypothetical protein